jgi:hypothetical protein
MLSSSPGVITLVFFQKLWTVPQVARDQIVGAGSVGTFEEFVVVRIFRHLQDARGMNRSRVILN